MRYVALLRAANIGGRNRIAMKDLRAILEARGYDDVETYVQSGNAVFTGAKRSPNVIEGEIESALADELGLNLSVLIRTSADIRKTIEKNPFLPKVAMEFLHANFLSANPTAATMKALDAERYKPDAYAPGDRVFYFHSPNGLGRSKLVGYLSEKRLGVTATARNWRTVTNLDAMLRG